MEKPIDEARGAALAAYMLSTGIFRKLIEIKVLKTDAWNSILRGLLLSLEKHEPDAAAHAARGLLSAFAEELGLEMRRPH